MMPTTRLILSTGVAAPERLAGSRSFAGSRPVVMCRAFTGVLLAVSFVGCGEAPEDPIARQTVPVQMTVTHEGEPIPDGVITFHPVEPRRDDKPSVTPRGIAQPDGSVVVSTYTKGDGAPPGQYRLAVSWQGPLDGLDEDEIDELKERLPRRLLGPTTSGLEVTIAPEGETVVPPINL